VVCFSLFLSTASLQTLQTKISGVLNDEFVGDLPGFLSTVTFFSFMRALFCAPRFRLVGFSNANILQGRVATRLRCCGIFNDHLVANSLLSVAVKGFLKVSEYLTKL